MGLGVGIKGSRSLTFFLFHITVKLCPGRPTSAVSHTVNRLLPALLKAPANSQNESQGPALSLILPIPLSFQLGQYPAETRPSRYTLAYTFLHKPSPFFLTSLLEYNCFTLLC